MFDVTYFLVNKRIILKLPLEKTKIPIFFPPKKYKNSPTFFTSKKNSPTKFKNVPTGFPHKIYKKKLKNTKSIHKNQNLSFNCVFEFFRGNDPWGIFEFFRWIFVFFRGVFNMILKDHIN